jgi:hypothetical protein
MHTISQGNSLRRSMALKLIWSIIKSEADEYIIRNFTR